MGLNSWRTLRLCEGSRIETVDAVEHRREDAMLLRNEPDMTERKEEAEAGRMESRLGGSRDLDASLNAKGANGRGSLPSAE